MELTLSKMLALTGRRVVPTSRKWGTVYVTKIRVHRQWALRGEQRRCIWLKSRVCWGHLSLAWCYVLNSVPIIHMLKPQLRVPQNVTVFGEGSLMWRFNWTVVLIRRGDEDNQWDAGQQRKTMRGHGKKAAACRSGEEAPKKHPVDTWISDFQPLELGEN